jgi:hypothetical protein
MGAVEEAAEVEVVMAAEASAVSASALVAEEARPQQLCWAVASSRFRRIAAFLRL